MSQEMMKVRACGTAKLPVPGMRGRFVGRDKGGEIIAEGVDVAADSYHMRAVARGEIEIMRAEKPAKMKAEVSK